MRASHNSIQLALTKPTIKSIKILPPISFCIISNNPVFVFVKSAKPKDPV